MPIIKSLASSLKVYKTTISIYESKLEDLMKSAM